MKLKLFALSLIAFAITSCGGSSTKDEPVLIKPTQAEVKGDLKDCFTVVDKSYQVKWDGSKKIITIEVMRTDAELPFDRDNFDVCANKGENDKPQVAGFGIELIDSLGTVVAQISPSEANYYEDVMSSALRLLPGESGAVTFSYYDNWDWSITGFRILSLVEANEKEEKEGDLFDRVADKMLNDAEEEVTEEVKEEVNAKKSEYDEDIEDAKKALEVTKDLIETEKKLLELL